MNTTLRLLAQRAFARAIRDKRPLPKYSWRWMNRTCCDLHWVNPGAVIRPQYAWGALHAAALARSLGTGGASLLELGVAGGNGLIALQSIADTVGRMFDVTLEVYGFDMGSGLPPITDILDLPQLYAPGDYAMDPGALRKRLSPRTKLVIGNVRETIADFVETPHLPIGFVSFDLDLYTSTRDALHAFSRLDGCLPRVACYFDDIMSMASCEITGERLAIREYNERHFPERAISPIHGLRCDMEWPHSKERWPDMMFMAHFLRHSQYGTYDGLSPVRHAPLLAT